MKRILIVNVNWRGDVLFSTPFIRALRKSYPESFIACLSVPRCYEILANNPHLNEVIVYDQDGKHKSFVGSLRLISELKKRKFDAAFLLHRSFTRRLLTFFARIPQRIGYDTKKKGILLTQKIKSPQEDLHRIDYFLNLAQEVGVKTQGRGYEFFISGDDQEYADSWLSEQGVGKEDFLAVINPGGNWLLKRWPAENFAHLADALVEKYGAKILVSGAAKDLKLAKKVIALMQKRAISSCGQTTLSQLGGIFRKANLVISNDSGPLHIALAAKSAEDRDGTFLDSRNTKVIALFGPTSIKITGPPIQRGHAILQKDIGCSIPCYNLSCPDNRCMQAISVEDVLSAIEKLRPQLIK